jgi:uncharacterized protein DUF4276
MSRVVAVVEGKTEQTFIRDVLVPALSEKGVFMSPRVVGKPGHKGGNVKYPRVRKDILGLLKQDPELYCTTMFDFYALPLDWPGYEESRSQSYPHNAECIENAVAEDIVLTLGSSFDSRRVVPYIQMYEFEALLFSNTDILSITIQKSDRKNELQSLVRQFGCPEKIDDDPNGAPSKRIRKFAPHYQKVIQGAITAQRIGLDAIRQGCPRFHKWITTLESLGDVQV